MIDSIHTSGLRATGTALPERFSPLVELPLVSPAETLAGFGFTGAWIADDVHALAKRAAERALAEARLAPEHIGALLWAGALPASHVSASTAPAGNVLDAFCFSASRLQEELGLNHASVCGIAQQGCAGMLAALRHARALLAAEPELEHVLCVGADALPEGAQREILYNVISDAACACVVSRRLAFLTWRSEAWISKGWYWDVPARLAEIIASYFPSSRAVINSALTKAGMRPEEIDLVISTGINASSWPVLLRLCGIPEDRLYKARENFGHTVAADTILTLEDARKAGRLRPGMRLLLFTYGFGSSWCAAVAEVTANETD
ncbi:MAG TPA: 3-oxoacyl-[acyl-carrier-protein] synthase III C-terminal domain-containing protein [Verrucomicrobiales bacterium]|nr:3-oxoacyl-[acyl-carrier-protein] synthase III C-terminal domain-containing protein [Verrucomicrobiales bacterium]